MRRNVECAECGHVRSNMGRDLCSACWKAANRAGTLHHYPSAHDKAMMRVSEYLEMSEDGFSWADIALRLRVTQRSLRRYKDWVEDGTYVTWLENQIAR